MSAELEFEPYFRELLPDAISVARRILGSQEEAEDAAAEAFARAYVRWSKVRKLSHRDAWLLRVVANISIDWVRRRRLLSEPEVPIARSDADHLALRMALAEALRRLPERQRRVVVLHHLAGWPVAQVAGSLGISANTVKKHSQRGLAALRGTFGTTWEVFDAL